MTGASHLRAALDELFEKFGRPQVVAAIQEARPTEENILTIVSNRGLHEPPQEYLQGEIYYASEGSIDFDCILTVEKYLDEITKNLQMKLLEKRWNKIILVPFGHVVINMCIKMVVFRTLWIETSDVFYFGNGKYGVLNRDTKKILAAMKGE